MRDVLFQRNLSTDPTSCDTITVELRNIVSPHAMFTSYKGILHTNGNISVLLPNSVITNSYYIFVHHRNSIDIWSKNPLLFNSMSMSFDFTAP